MIATGYRECMFSFYATLLFLYTVPEASSLEPGVFQLLLIIRTALSSEARSQRVGCCCVLAVQLHGRKCGMLGDFAIASHAHIAMWISDGINSHDNRNKHEHAIALWQPAHPGLAAGLRAGALLL